jgi:Secretion system C-terminal sorting domain/SprB repeat
MKKIFIFYILIFNTLMLCGQAGLQLKYKICTECPNGDQQNISYTYSATPGNYDTEHVESDYDMRITQGTKYHQGIDYIPRDSCRGDAVLSIEGGIVTFVKGDGNLKNIVIQNGTTRAFVYMHIFIDGAVPAAGMRSGNFMLKRVGNQYAIINMSQTPAIAYARDTGLQVIYKRYANSTTFDTVYTQNAVSAGDMIAPIGDSGGVPLHLHVALIEDPIPFNSITSQPDPAFLGGREIDRSIDPWTEISHANNKLDQRIRTRKPGNFSLQACEHTGPGSDQWGQIKLEYSGETRNTIEIEVLMENAQAAGDPSRYNNTVMDQEEVVLGIKNIGSNNDFQVANGSDFESKFVLNPVGTKLIYPSRMYDTKGGKYGNPTTTGMSPMTYRDYTGFHPHDHYFISDFCLRLHKNDKKLPAITTDLALYPWDAMYQDGNYQFRTNVLDVDGTWNAMTNPINFTIDNFNPFVYGINAYFSNANDPVYSRYWEPTSGGKINLGLRQSRAVPDPSNPGDLTIYALSSEAMLDMKARIPGPFPNWQSGTKQSTNPNGTEIWAFQMGASGTIIADECYRIEFDGHDLAGNRILKFELPAECSKNTLTKTLPYRNGANTWANSHAQGEDKVHFIKLTPCAQKSPGPEEPCITNDDIITNVRYATEGNADGGVDITVLGDHPTTSFLWTDDTGAEMGTAANLTNVPNGVYCVEIKEDCCVLSGCFEIKNCASELVTDFTHPTSSAPNTGEIHVSITGGDEPFEYLWSNGATTADLTDLAAGSYCVTATDYFSCDLVDCITLITCPPIEILAGVIATPPTACLNNGSIKILTVSATGGVAPYTFTVQNEAGEQMVQGQFGGYADLPAGKYFLVATDAKGCTGTKEIDLGEPGMIPVLEADVLPACSNQTNGHITLTAFDPEFNLYNFVWDDPNNTITENDLVSELAGLTAGTYCVTVTSTVNECTYTTCLEVEEVSSQTPLVLTGITSNPCPGEPNGNIDISISGGRPPYTYYWEGPGIQAFAAEDQLNIEEGAYSVTVTDYCGATIVANYYLKSMRVQTSATPGCTGEGTIAAEILDGGTPVYSYKWINPAGTFRSEQATNEHVKTDEYCVTVTDALGCTASDCLILHNSEVIYEVEKSCANMTNGSVTLHILNPHNEPVTVFFESSLIYSSPSGPSELSIPVQNLPVGEFSLMWEIGNCVSSQASSTVRVREAETQHEFISYDRDKEECKMQDLCKGEVIPGSITISDPEIHFWDPQGTTVWNTWKRRCEVPVYCGDEEVATKKYWLKKLRVGQYLTLLNNNPYVSSAFADVLIKILENEDNCEWVRFCPATLEIYGTAEDLNPEPGPMTMDGTGCWTLRCGLDNESFCIDDLVESVFPENVYGEDLYACNAGDASLEELILWHSTLGLSYPAYQPGTPLYDFVENNINSPVAPCAFIRFCWSDFTILEVPDLSTIECGSPSLPIIIPPGSQFNWEWIEPIVPLPTLPLPIEINCCGPLPVNMAFINEDDCITRVCIDPASLSVIGLDEFGIPVYGTLNQVCSTPEPPGFTGGGLEERLVINPPTGRDFYNFGQVILNGVSQPKGLIKQGSSDTYYLDYTTVSKKERYLQMPENDFFIDDWDVDQLLFVQPVEMGKTYALRTEVGNDNNDNDWSRVLSADQISVKSLEKIDSFYFIGGQYSGTLKIDNYPVSSSSMAGFLIKTNVQGDVLWHSSIDNLDGRSAPVFHKYAHGIGISLVNNGNGISLDGNNYSAQNGSVLTVKSDGVFNTLTNNSLRIDTNLTLIKSAQSWDGNTVTYLFRGTGQVFDGGQTLHPSANNDLVLVTTQNTGALVWTEKIPLQYLDVNALDIKYLSNGQLALGLTFTDSVTIQGKPFMSKGETDILLVSFAPNGTINWSEKYGTIQKETIKKMFTMNNRLYFGGEFGGSISYRQIGADKLLTFTNSVSNPYITYINESVTAVGNKGALENRGLNRTSISVPKVTVYPNPFSNNLTVAITTDKVENLVIKVFNVSGVLINEFSATSTLGTNEIEIKPNATLSPGIYFVEVQSDSILTRQFKVVKQKD